MLIRNQKTIPMAEQNHDCGDAKALNAGILENKHWAFDCLYKKCYPAVSGWLIRHGASREDAEDFFQDALIKYRGAILRETPVEAPCAYLGTIARNDFYQRQKRDKPMEPLRDDTRAALNFDGQDGFSPDDWARAYDRILALGKAEQKLLFMTFFNKFPDEQIASSLGYLNLNTMRAARSRAMSKLKEEK